MFSLPIHLRCELGWSFATLESFDPLAPFGGNFGYAVFLTIAEGEIGIGSKALRSDRRMSSICSM
jgi:hypothetical protein